MNFLVSVNLKKKKDTRTGNSPVLSTVAGKIFNAYIYLYSIGFIWFSLQMSKGLKEAVSAELPLF